jgi:YjbE family integral membrane protein
MEMLTTGEFWIAVGQIIMIDILLGGDNAVVIALACRKLPPLQRTRGILWGTAGAIVLRIVLIFFALQLLAIPFLKIVGAVLLIWIGVKLLLPEAAEGHGNIEGSERLWGAVKTVIVADFVMSVDNVIAIAGAADASGTGHGMALVIFGVLVSIPIIVWGSQMVIKLMDRYPAIITLGGMLLGWIAGTMAVTDPALVNPDVVPQLPKLVAGDLLRYGAGVAGALLVLALGKALAARGAPAAAPVAEGARARGGMQRVLLPAAMEIHLLNVQRPVSGDVSSFIASKSLQEYHDEKSAEALASSRAMLDAGGVAYREHRQVGSPGTTIADFAQTHDCDLIIMGTRGLGSNTAALLGSVAQSAIEHSSVPVLLVK